MLEAKPWLLIHQAHALDNPTLRYRLFVVSAISLMYITEMTKYVLCYQFSMTYCHIVLVC